MLDKMLKSLRLATGQEVPGSHGSHGIHGPCGSCGSCDAWENLHTFLVCDAVHLMSDRLKAILLKAWFLVSVRA